MKENIELRKYLLRRFFVTLICIGMIELIINLFFGRFLNAMIEHSFQFDGLLSGNNIQSTYLTMLKFCVVMLLHVLIQMTPNFTRLLGDEFLAFMFGDSLVAVMSQLNETMTDGEIVWYMIRVILFALLLFVIWVMPYMVGAMLFSKSVHRKVNELEKKRIAKEQEYEKQRNLLLSDVAHDIRTPITTVVGFSKALADGEVRNEQTKEYLDAIYRKALQVSDLVTLLFEYVKLDSAGYTLHKAKKDFCEIVRTCVARMYADFEEKDMELKLQIPEDTIMIETDQMQLERAIGNVLSNTLKHNPPKTKVMIEVKKTNRTVCLCISDMGVRIDREIAIHLFEPFVQGDSSRTSGSGTGLGLSICKKIIDMHGGKVRLIQYNHPERYGKVKSFELTVPCL